MATTQSILAMGSFQTVIGQIISYGLQFLMRDTADYICFPLDRHIQLRNMHEFYRLGYFPSVLRPVHSMCHHMKPSTDAHVYINSQRTCTLNLKTDYNALHWCFGVVAKFPESCQDLVISKTRKVRQRGFASGLAAK
ncbi:unnamed protein product [Caretta caretta]